MKNKNQTIFLSFMAVFALLLIFLSFGNETSRLIALYLLIIFVIFASTGIVLFRKRQNKIKQEYLMFKSSDDSKNLHKNIDKYIQKSKLLTEKEFGHYLKFMTYLKEDKLELAKEVAPKISPDRAFFTNYYLYLLEFSEKNYAEAEKIYIELNELRGNFNSKDTANLKAFTEIIDQVNKGTLWDDTANTEKLKSSDFLFLHRLAYNVPLYLMNK